MMHATEITRDNPTLKKYISYFDCKECLTWDPAHYFVFEPLENLITWFPDKRLIHIHFGKPSWLEDITNKESHWVYEVTDACIQAGPAPIFCTADFSHIDDSEFPTKEAITMYGRAVGREGTAHVVSYGSSSSMAMIMRMIATISTTARKVEFAPGHDDAMKIYEQWFANTPPVGTVNTETPL